MREDHSSLPNFFSGGKNSSIVQGIAGTRLLEGLFPDLAGVAGSAGAVSRLGVVTGPGEGVIDAQSLSQLDDLDLGQPDQGGVDGKGMSLGPGLGAQVGQSLEGGDEFGTAIRIPGKVHGVRPDVDIGRADLLGEGEGEGEKDGVSGGDVGGRDLIVPGHVAMEGDGFGAGEGGADEQLRVEPDDAMAVFEAQGAGDVFCGLDFALVALSVPEGQGVTEESVADRAGQGRRGIQSAAEQHHRVSGRVPCGHHAGSSEFFFLVTPKNFSSFPLRVKIFAKNAEIIKKISNTELKTIFFLDKRKDMIPNRN